MIKKLFKLLPFPFFHKTEKVQGCAEFGSILAGLIVAVLIGIAILRDSLICCSSDCGQ